MNSNALTVLTMALAATTGSPRSSPANAPGPGDDRTFPAADVDFFETRVRPILEENCFRCHGGRGGGEEVKLRAGLQLTSRAGLLKGGAHGPAIDLARPGKSLLLAMISYRDENHEMPPGGRLEPAQIRAITRWVELGAPWTPGAGAETVETQDARRDLDREIDEAAQGYWAYRRPRRPVVPRVSTPDWQEHPIDALLAARLEAHGLRPAPPASRRELARRVFYDVTGLPPSPADVEAFVDDNAPGAWERLVDRLLASPHYGEKWARHWLDLVRYAESNGYERDSDKAEIWRYRDYVIRSFNDDKPYDRFVREQLAGDELRELTVDSIVATGYLRLHLWDDEPADRLQARYDNLDDIVRTTSETFLGTTLGCARCHEHKKDPIPQEDYYAFMAFFNNLTPMGTDSVLRSLEGLAPDREAVRSREERERRRQALQERIRQIERLARDGLEESDRADGTIRDSSLEASEVLLADSRKTAQTWLYTTRRPPGEWMTNGYVPDRESWRAGPGGFGRRGTPGAVVRTEWTSPDIWLRGDFRLTSIPSSAILIVHHDEDAEIYLNGQRIASLAGFLTGYRTIRLDARALASLQTGKNVLAVHCRHTVGGQYIDLGLRVPSGQSNEMESRLVRNGGSPPAAARLEEYRRLRDALEGLSTLDTEGGATGRAMCAAERGREAPDMHVHIRGSAHSPGEQVAPAFPRMLRPPEPVIPALPEHVSSSGRRLALANWITSPANPLTARVLVNRLWQHYFRRGIVGTPNDFGRLGEAPTHPEVLDWLAAELMEGGWRLKRLHKIILTSRAYQMSSRAHSRGLEIDPENQLFWRQTMRRLTAEEIRDSILVVSGNFNPRMHGPSIYPPLPAEVLATSSTGAGKWGRSPPTETARRSIYIKVKRSLLHPLLTDFDLADTDSSCPVRFSSTVPTQALGMLNSEFVNDQATVFARRLLTDFPSSVEVRVRRGLELVTGRPPRAAEVESCLSFMTSVETEEGLSREQSLERFALIALNLNEFLYLD